MPADVAVVVVSGWNVVMGSHRVMRATTRQVDELYAWLLGRPDQLEPLYARLRELGVSEPTEAEQAVEKITGSPSGARRWSYKELLLAMLNDHADSLDNAVDELGRWVDHLRQVGIRGFIAEHTNDADFARSGSGADEAASGDSEDQPPSEERGARSGRMTSTGTRRAKP